MKKILILVVACGLFAIPADAQQLNVKPGDVKVEALELEIQQTPQFQAGGLKDKNIPNPRDWLELEIEFEVDVRAPDNTVLPELLVKYYVGFKDQSGNGRTLTGQVIHKNVLVGEETFSAAYISPDTLGEVTGEYRNFQASDVAGYGVEIFYNGVLVGLKSSLSGASQKFWEKTGTTEGVLPKHETPFELLWIDRYADVKKN